MMINFKTQVSIITHTISMIDRQCELSKVQAGLQGRVKMPPLSLMTEMKFKSTSNLVVNKSSSASSFVC
jgi:hypothetical protein